MTRICLCIKIHIPLVYRDYRFFSIHRDHSYFDETQLRHYTEKLSAEKLIPFLKAVKEISLQSNGKFRAGISVSGLALQQLTGYAPEVVVRLAELIFNNTLELLSEPWSHSLLALLGKSSLQEQTGLHDRAAKAAFGVVPSIFIAYSPLSPGLIPAITGSGKKGIFCYSNHLLKDPGAPTSSTVLINHTLDRLLAETDSSDNSLAHSETSSLLIKKRLEDYSPEFPAVMIFRPLSVSPPFGSARAAVWKNMVKALADDSQNSFLLPSEMAAQYPSFPNGEVPPERRLQPFKIPHYWLRNDLQREAFKKMKLISAAVKEENRAPVAAVWQRIQDMENLRFMDLRFLENRYAGSHFNPFASPYLASINYMNVLDDFFGVVMAGKFRKRHTARFSYH